MNVRQLTEAELPEAGMISHIAFHCRKDDPAEIPAEWAVREGSEWGAFTDDGTMAARIINNRFTCRLDGKEIPCGGIGAVSTLPESRESGAVRAIFEKLLPEARKSGEVLSALYPFNHAFYRKFGYESVCVRRIFELTTADLAGHSHKGWARMYKPGDSAEEYVKIYRTFAAGYNLSMVRDERVFMEQLLNGLYYKDRNFGYLLGKGETACAYVIFKDVVHPDAARMEVREAAWTGPDGFEAVLGFLNRFTADYGSVQLTLPADLDLGMIVRDPYRIKDVSRYGYMVRVMNTEKLLETMRRPEGISAVISVSGDEQIPENNGTFLVTDSGVTRTDTEPDLCLSHRALGRLACGAVGIDQAVLCGDVQVNSNPAALRELFPKKPVYVGDHF